MYTTRVAARPFGIQATNGRAPLLRGAPAVTANGYVEMYIEVAEATSPYQ